MPFLYESTGIITRLNDAHDPKLRSRDILFSPARNAHVRATGLRERLQHILPLNPGHLRAKEPRLRDCQEIAINNLEASFKASRPRAPIQMATGAGKIYTAITSIYRHLRLRLCGHISNDCP